MDSAEKSSSELTPGRIVEPNLPKEPTEKMHSSGTGEMHSSEITRTISTAYFSVRTNIARLPEFARNFFKNIGARFRTAPQEIPLESLIKLRSVDDASQPTASGSEEPVFGKELPKSRALKILQDKMPLLLFQKGCQSFQEINKLSEEEFSSFCQQMYGQTGEKNLCHSFLQEVIDFAKKLTPSPSWSQKLVPLPKQDTGIRSPRFEQPQRKIETLSRPIQTHLQRPTAKNFALLKETLTENPANVSDNIADIAFNLDFRKNISVPPWGPIFFAFIHIAGEKRCGSKKDLKELSESAFEQLCNDLKAKSKGNEKACELFIADLKSLRDEP